MHTQMRVGALIALFICSLLFPLQSFAIEVTYTFPAISGDGYVYNVSPQSYPTWDDAIGEYADATSSIITVGRSNSGSMNHYYRGFLPFDTTALPPNAKIKSATVGIWASEARVPYFGATSIGYIILLSGATQHSTSTLEESDYSRAGATSGPYNAFASTKLSYTAPFSTTSYSSFTLDGEGIRAIQKGGYTTLGVRDGGDLEGVNPPEEIFSRFFSSEGPIGQRPYLEIVVDIDPTSPTGLEVDGAVNPLHISTGTPTFSAIFQSPTSTALATSYEIQVSTSSDFSSVYWNSGIQSLASGVVVGDRMPGVISGVAFPQDSSSYYWRIKFWDDSSSEGAWSVSNDFFTISFPVSTSTHTLFQQVARDTGPLTAGSAFGGTVQTYLAQRITCAAVQGEISDVALRGLGQALPIIPNLYLTDNNGHQSNTVPVALYPSPLTRHVFHFLNPIPCIDGIIDLQIKGTANYTENGVYFEGTLNGLPGGTQCIGACRSTRNLYFELIGTSIIPPTTPLDPSNLLVTNISTSTISLAWVDSAVNEDGYTVERSRDGFSFTTIVTTSADTPNFTDTDLAPGTSYHYRVRAFNEVGTSGYSNVSSATTSPTIAITTATLPEVTVGKSYTQTLAAVNATNPLSWAIVSGALPGGLSLGVSTGIISGTTTSVGDYSFTVSVTDSNIQVATTSLNIIVNPLPSVTTATLPRGTVGVAYTTNLQTSGGTAPFTWSITSGTLPAGLSLSAGGVISGTPTNVVTRTFTVMVTDNYGASAMTSLTLTVKNPLKLNTGALPGGKVGAPYSKTLVASGGYIPYTWNIASGTLPAGLSLDSESGIISGTPISPVVRLPVSIQVADTNGQIVTKNFTITVNILHVTTGSLPTGQVGDAYTKTLAATGGVTPYVWSVASGTLPSGLNLDPSGIISGTPSAAGTYAVTLEVVDVDLVADTKDFSVTVTATNITTATLPNGKVGNAYSKQLNANGGTAPYVWSLVGGTLPLGLTLDGVGLISGTSTTAGTENISVQATDINGVSDTKNYSLKVNP